MIGKVWKRPSSKIYENLTANNVNFIPTKLQFFSFIVSLLEPFLLKYQSDKTMLPLLHGSSGTSQKSSNNQTHPSSRMLHCD